MMDAMAVHEAGLDLNYACPNCGSTAGKPVPYDFGTDPETGYHDAGEGCTECTPEGGK